MFRFLLRDFVRNGFLSAKHISDKNDGNILNLVVGEKQSVSITVLGYRVVRENFILIQFSSENCGAVDCSQLL